METNIKKMSCGNCGNGNAFKVYRSLQTKNLYIECVCCKSTTIVSPSKPKLELDFGEDSEGRLCFLEEDIDDYD